MSAENSFLNSSGVGAGATNISNDKSNQKDTKLKKQHSLIFSNDNYNPATRKDSTPINNKSMSEGDKTANSDEDKFKRFEGDGVVFKTKLVGSELVMEPRGDKMCQNSIQRLKAIIKGQKAHKQRVVMRISYDGVKIYDEKTNEQLYHHEVPQISFISSDDTDNRTFGYVCDVPNKAHQFICFKTSGPAIEVMSVISSLFEAVLEKKKKEEESKNEFSGTSVSGSTTTSNNNNSISPTSNNNNNDSSSSNKNKTASESLLDELIDFSVTPSNMFFPPQPTPNMMVPIRPSASAVFVPDAASEGMIVGSAPLGGHQMSAHARFSSSMVAGLHQRLGSSAASIQSVGSSGGLSRRTNPFDDDFFS